MKRILAFLLALLCMLPAAGAEGTDDSARLMEENHIGPGYAVGGEDWVILFEEPDADSAEIAMIWPGEALEIYSHSGSEDFVLCEYNEMIGFVMSENVAQAGTATCVEEEVVESGAGTVSARAVGDDWVILYGEPSETSDEVAMIWPGEMLEVHAGEEYGEFLKCEYSGMTGYVRKTDLESADASAASSGQSAAGGYTNQVAAAVGEAQEKIQNSSGSASSSSSSSSSGSSSGMREDRPGKWMNDINYVGPMRIANCDEWVSLREHPDTDSDRLAKVPLGDYVEAYMYSPNPDFYVCETADGKVGFILVKYLEYGTDAPAGVGPSGSASSSNSSSSSSASSSGMKEDRPAKYMNNQNALGEWYVAHCDEWVSLREHPDTGSKRIEKVYLNDYVQAYEYSPNPDFYLCETSSGNIGFILKKYLECVMDVPDDIYYGEIAKDDPWAYVCDDNFMGGLTVVNCDEWVSLREKADTGSKRLAKVPLWADVDAYYYPPNPDFYVCIYQGEIGFILEKYLGT